MIPVWSVSVLELFMYITMRSKTAWRICPKEIFIRIGYKNEKIFMCYLGHNDNNRCIHDIGCHGTQDAVCYKIMRVGTNGSQSGGDSWIENDRCKGV